MFLINLVLAKQVNIYSVKSLIMTRTQWKLNYSFHIAFFLPPCCHYCLIVKIHIWFFAGRIMVWIFSLCFCIFFGFEYWFSNIIKLCWFIFRYYLNCKYWVQYISLGSNGFQLLVSLYTFTVYFHFKIFPSILVLKCFSTQLFLIYNF